MILCYQHKNPTADAGYVEYFFKGPARINYRQEYRRIVPEPDVCTGDYHGSDHEKWSEGFLAWLIDHNDLAEITTKPI